jgi:predicted transcriptional regulator
VLAICKSGTALNEMKVQDVMNLNAQVISKDDTVTNALHVMRTKASEPFAGNGCGEAA